MLGTNMKIIDICGKQDSWSSASKFLSKFVDKWEQAKWCWNLSVYSSKFRSCSVDSENPLKKYANEQILVQSVKDYILFTDFIDV